MDDSVILIILLIISAYFSGAEMAYVVANKIKIEIKARKKNLSAENAMFFINNPQTLFSTILVGNNIVNIAFASLAAIYLTNYQFTELGVLLFTTMVLLIIGEILPKYISREFANSVFLFSAIPLRIISFVLYPIIKITSAISSKLTRSNNLAEENITYLINKEDIEELVKESHQAGIVNKKESDIIGRVMNLGDQRVYEVMRPRTDIVGVEINQDINQVISLFVDSGYSKLPVFEENLDNIKGVIFSYDIFNIPKDLKSIVREVIFVPDTKKTFELLNLFLNKRISIAIVIDEFGGTAGLVTLEDIIEELLGEIKDEYDVEEDICKEMEEPRTYLISGKVEIDYINEKFNLNIPEGDYETIAGYIISRIGKIPNQGERHTIDNFNVLIARAKTTRIDLVKLSLKEEV